MPERLDRVLVRVDGEDYVIEWATREELLSWLAGVPGEGERAIAQFRAVGATRPVELSPSEQGALLLAVLPHEVANAGDRWLPCERAVGSAFVVVAEPV
jgi:hypothetical protein